LTIMSTPGHTPGHQSLLVKLPKTGAIILTGDAVHFKSNWDNRGVPVNNFSKEQTLASMEKLSGVLTREKAPLWINHDKAQRDGIKLSPEFYDRAARRNRQSKRSPRSPQLEASATDSNAS